MPKKEFSFNARGIGYDEFINDNSIKVLTFLYIIPRPIIPPIRRVSKLYLVRKDEKPSSIAKRFNVFSILFGWLGFPFGPSYVYKAVVKNKSGIDMTIDFRANINKKDFEKGLMIYEKVEEIFINPDKDTLKELKKALKKYHRKEIGLRGDCFFGLRIDVEEPIYFIGLSSKDYENSGLILKYIYKYFYSHVSFQIVDIESDLSIIDKLKEQAYLFKIE